MIRVAVAAPYPMVRLGLITALTQQRGDQVLPVVSLDLQIVGEVSNAADLLTTVARTQPDVVLIDPGSPDSEMANALWMILADADRSSTFSGPPTTPGSDLTAHVLPLVVMTDPANDEWAADLLRSGVRSLLPRDAVPEAIVAAIVAASHGLLVLHPSLIGSVLAHPALLPAPLTPLKAGHSRGAILTRREIEVLQLVAQGLGNKTIAARLSLSDHTIKFHMGAIMTKLGAASRAEAVAIAARQGLILL